MRGRAVGRAVVGQHALDADAVAGEVSERSREKADGSAGLLVAEHLGVGQAGGVVDGDVYVLPADGLVPPARSVGEAGVVVLAQAVAHPLARTALDAAQLLDVDVDQLAGALTLIAAGRLQAQATELARPDPGADP